MNSSVSNSTVLPPTTIQTQFPNGHPHSNLMVIGQLHTTEVLVYLALKNLYEFVFNKRDHFYKKLD